MSVEHLLEMVQSGRVRNPIFQRELLWEAKHIFLLFDSIYRGYPIGTLLFWKRPAEAAVVQVGPVRIDAPTRQDALWVVDGQQRITSLTGVLVGNYDDPTDDHALFFDLAHEKFEQATRRRPPQPSWLPLNRVVDSARLLTWLHEQGQGMDARQIDAAIRLGKRVREYQVPAYVVETEDEEPLRQIFDRTNSGGKPLAAADVFEALHGRQEHEPSGLRAIADALEETGFGRIEVKLVLQAVLAVTGKDVGRTFREQLGDEEVPEALTRTRDALRRAIVFLQGDAGIPHIGLMPYRLPLVTLARFFDLHPEPEARSIVLLARWLWRGAINSRHQGNTVATRKTLQAIGPDETQAVQALLSDVGNALDEPLPLTPYNFRYARSKLCTLALWALEPRHLATGKSLRITEIMGNGTPIQQIRAPRKDDAPIARGLANALLHPPVPGGPRRLLVEQGNQVTWTSHGITPDAMNALREGNFLRFLILRQQVLEGHVGQFLKAKAQWEATDRPSIDSLVVED